MSYTLPSSFIQFCESWLTVAFEPGQRPFWRVFADDVQPIDLEGADREIARELFGDVDEIPDAARSVAAVIKGADTGFSYFAGYWLLFSAWTSQALGTAGETRPALCVAPDLRLGRIPVSYALGAAESVPEIRTLIESRGADGFVLRRRGGRKTSVETLPASVGGRALRGRRYVASLFDEASFFRDANFAVNDGECIGAVMPRCLGKLLLGSTPWSETAEVWQIYERNFGAPRDALAARMPTLLVRNDPRVVSLVESRRALDPEGAAVEFDCQCVAAGAQAFFDPSSIAAAMDENLLPFSRGARP